MIFITYVLKGNEVYRDNQPISLEQAKQEIGYDRMYRLKKEGKIKVNPLKMLINPAETLRDLTDEELFKEYKDNYKITRQPYKNNVKLYIERKNAHYGYYNFLTYINSEDEFEKIVTKDIKEHLEENKKLNKGKRVTC